MQWTIFGLIVLLAAGRLFSFPADAVAPSDYGLTEGDLISASGSNDPDIYIVNEHGYKRLFLNQAIFTMYGHLKWENVRSVSSTTRDAFPTSGLFRNCEANDPKVYGVEVTAEDAGTLHWVNVSGEEAQVEDPDFFKKVFCINTAEFYWYAKSTDYTAVSQVLQYDRSAMPAQQPLTFTWTKDTGSRVASGNVPFAYKFSDGRVRLYYCGQGGILSAISSDGLAFTQESGVRVSPGTGNESVVCDPTLVTLPDGRVRMYYKGANGAMGGPGQAIHKIYSAISSDGLAFTKEGLRLDSETSGDGGWASVPDAIVLPDGRVRLYFVSEAADAEHGIASAISTDGLVFTKEPGARVGGLVDPAVFHLTDGRYFLLVVSLDPALSPYLARGIYSYVSNDGLSFSSQQAVLIENDIFDPTIVQLDEKTFRVYYGKNVGTANTTESITGRLP